MLLCMKTDTSWYLPDHTSLKSIATAPISLPHTCPGACHQVYRWGVPPRRPRLHFGAALLLCLLYGQVWRNQVLECNIDRDHLPLATTWGAPLLFEAFCSILFLPFSNSFTVRAPTDSTAPRFFPRSPFTSRFFSWTFLTSWLVLSDSPFSPLLSSFRRTFKDDNFRGEMPSPRFLIWSSSFLVLSSSTFDLFLLTSPLAFVSWPGFIPRSLLRDFYLSSPLLSFSFLLIHNFKPLPLIVVPRHGSTTAPSSPLLWG